MREKALLVSLCLFLFGIIGGTLKSNQASSEVIDVLSYVVGSPQTWARNGDHEMNQIVRGNSITFVKFADPEWWERWTWDNEYIYHYEDHSANEPYVFSDGRWAKRFMRVGESLYMGANVIQHYTRNGCTASFVGPFAYEMQLVAHYDRYDAGGSIGVADVIVLKYDPTWSKPGRAGGYELFFFAKGWGWFLWEAWHYNSNTLTYRTTFNRLGGQPTRPGLACRPHPESAEPPVLRPEIYSLKPESMEQGDVLTLVGRDLLDYIQFADSMGRIYEFGPAHGVRVLGDRSQTYFRVPLLLSPGTWRVSSSSGRRSDLVSNSRTLIIVEPHPVSDHPPVGVFDVANCEIIGGWAFDPDVPTLSIDVHMYKDDPGTSAYFLGSWGTSSLRPDVNAAYNISGYHGFTFATPRSLKDGHAHSLSLYAINDKKNNQNPPIASSPKTIICPASIR